MWAAGVAAAEAEAAAHRDGPAAGPPVRRDGARTAGLVPAMSAREAQCTRCSPAGGEWALAGWEPDAALSASGPGCHLKAAQRAGGCRFQRLAAEGQRGDAELAGVRHPSGSCLAEVVAPPPEMGRKVSQVGVLHTQAGATSDFCRCNGSSEAMFPELVPVRECWRAGPTVAESAD